MGGSLPLGELMEGRVAVSLPVCVSICMELQGLGWREHNPEPHLAK